MSALGDSIAEIIKESEKRRIELETAQRERRMKRFILGSFYLQLMLDGTAEMKDWPACAKIVAIHDVPEYGAAVQVTVTSPEFETVAEGDIIPLMTLSMRSVRRPKNTNPVVPSTEPGPAVLCAHCDGKGVYKGLLSTEKCNKCNGTGLSCT